MEAVIWGIPAVAVSVDSPDNHLGAVDYEAPASVAYKVARAVIQNGLQPTTLLNVNVPYLPVDQLKGIQITRQGLRVYHDKLDRREDPRGKPYYWTIGDLPTGIPERGTDIGALSEGFVSVTPLQLDLTDYQVMPYMNTWQWDADELGLPAPLERISSSSRKQSRVFSV